MERRAFLKFFFTFGCGVILSFATSGCVAPLVSQTVWDEASGPPWRCSNCGHLTRSRNDLTGTRCPRCKRKGFLGRITEEELASYLEKEKQSAQAQ